MANRLWWREVIQWAIFIGLFVTACGRSPSELPSANHVIESPVLRMVDRNPRESIPAQAIRFPLQLDIRADLEDRSQIFAKDIQIPSTKPWTDTGIVISEGDRITIKASGAVTWDSNNATTGPEGTKEDTGDGKSFVLTDPSVRAQALIGNVAERMTLDGKGFFVGRSFSGTVPIQGTTNKSGRLFLGFNDGAVFRDRSNYDAWGFGGDNHGSFLATIEVIRETAPTQSQKPVAHIDRVYPTESIKGESVWFIGNGSDVDGTIQGYEWVSNIDGPMGNVPVLETKNLSEGEHTISLIVVDNDGLKSDKVVTTIMVGVTKLDSPQARIRYIKPETSHFGDQIAFAGEGIDRGDGWVIKKEWKIDGKLLSEKQSFVTTEKISIGQHTITFRVQDNDGLWSEPEYETIKVTRTIEMDRFLDLSIALVSMAAGVIGTLVALRIIKRRL